MPVLHNLRVTLEMIKWEHSIFALPFALCGAMLAAGGWPPLHQLLWIIVAMVAARSAAMAFNRWADAAIDAANPRTSARALPAGHLSPAFVVTFVVISSAVFVLAASQLNRLTLLLSPVALAVLLLYSYTKRALYHGPRLMGESLRCHQQVPGLQRFFGRRLQQVDRLTCLPRGEPRHCHPNFACPLTNKSGSSMIRAAFSDSCRACSSLP